MTMLLALTPPSQAQDHSRAVVTGAPHYGGTLVWGTINPPTIINPVLTSHSVSESILELLFDPLVRINGQGRVMPGLAQSWDISKDGLVYTFHLRRHVYFHDGVECTAEDVKFTYEAIREPSNKSTWRTSTELVKEWRVIDPYTITGDTCLNLCLILFLNCCGKFCLNIYMNIPICLIIFIIIYR